MDPQQQNSAGPPMNPSYNQMPENTTGIGVSKNTELYNEITKEDEEVVVIPTKKKTSPFMFLVVLFMKATFYIDSVRRSHESFFHLLGGIWIGIMSLIYFCGIMTLILSIYSYVRMPLYLETFFKEHHLTYDSLKMKDFSLSQIEVKNLHDEHNIYKADQLNIQSTFADFLQRRVRTVTADGLKINLKTINSSGQDHLQDVLKVLGILTSPTDAGLKLKVNSLTINNAILTIEGEETKVPINFSLSGIYANDSQIIIPLSIDEPFLKMDATLSINGKRKNRVFDLEIKSGILALDNHPTEEFHGALTLEMQEDTLDTIQGEIQSDYTSTHKTMGINFQKEENGYAGTFHLDIKNSLTTASDSGLDLTLNLKELSVSKEGLLVTRSPIDMTLKNLAKNSAFFENVAGTLNGELTCSIKGKECRYSLNKEASLSYQKLAFKYKDNNIVFDEANRLLLQPSTDTFVFKLENSEVGLNTKIKDIDLAGYYNAPNNPLYINSAWCDIQAKTSDKMDGDILSVKVDDGSYQTNSVDMDHIKFNVDNLFNATSAIHLYSPKVILQSDLIKKPFSVDITSVNEKAKANIEILETGIRVMAEGNFQPFQKKFSGKIYVPEIELSTQPFQLFEISTLFPKEIKVASGKMAVMGELNYISPSDIATNRMYVVFKNLDFQVGQMAIQDMNTVIILKSLAPLISKGNQFFWIGKIDDFISLTNVEGKFQFENQNIRLLSMKAQLGNQNLLLGNTLIPYRRVNNILTYLKTERPFKMSDFAPYLNLKGVIPVGGEASISIPINITESGINTDSVVMKLNDVTLRSSDSGNDVVELFQGGKDGFMIKNGQVIFNDDNMLQMDLSGWYLPTKTTKMETFNQTGIKLTHPLFKAGEFESGSILKQIQKMQNTILGLAK